MNILSVDPNYSGQTGIAWFQYERLMTYQVFDSKRIRETRYGGEIIRNLLVNGTLTPIDVLIIEDSWFGFNAQISKKLIEAKMEWVVRAKDLGIKVVEVMPQSWQSKVQRKWRFGKKSKTDYNVIIDYVKKRFGVSEITKDAAAAVCIGATWLDMERMLEGLRR